MSNGCVFPEYDADPNVKRQEFPDDFMFGVGSSAYQVEGAYNADGKGLHIWDVHAMRHPDKITDGTNACVTIDSYHRMKEDVQLLKKMGVNYYRFSISWSRILPAGKAGMGKNQEGINYYNNLIDELQANGIEPFVTLYHWDLPNALEEEYLGFLSPKVIEDFVNYCEICFWEFGDRVKNWVTFNEPYRYTLGYVEGSCAPGRGGEGEDGDRETEPYTVAANILRCHAKVYRMYEKNFKRGQKGQVGITLDIIYYKPCDSDNADDIKAVEYAYDFAVGWFLEPLTNGTWPTNMKQFAETPSLHHDKRSLYKFTDEEIENLTKSYDFLGINYYKANFVQLNELPDGTLSDGYTADSRFTSFGSLRDEDGNIIKEVGPPAFEGTCNSFLCANQLVDLLFFLKKKYKIDKHIVITENGIPELSDPKKTYEQAKDDAFRVKYLKWHLDAIKRVNALLTADDTKKPLVKGYFAWSFTDSYEWIFGYTFRFGMTYVDYNNNLTRYPKSSAIWFRQFLTEDNDVKLSKPLVRNLVQTTLSKRSLFNYEQENEVANATPLYKSSEQATEAAQKLKKAKF